MKLTSIQFGGPMILPIKSGDKTKTRRAIKDQSLPDRFTRVEACYHCPYGAPGAILWVKEAMRQLPSGVWVYDADREPVTCTADNESDMLVWMHHKETDYQSAMFMPRWASRISIVLTDVQVERVQEICEADARAEGCIESVTGFHYPSAYVEFADLWDTINGAKYPWTSNPWVWVLAFKRVK